MIMDTKNIFSDKIILENDKVRVEFGGQGKIEAAFVSGRPVLKNEFQAIPLKIGYSAAKSKWDATSWEIFDAGYDRVKKDDDSRLVFESENVSGTGVNIKTAITLTEAGLNFKVRIQNEGQGTLVSVTPFSLKGIRSSAQAELYVPLSAGHKIRGAFETLKRKGCLKMSNIYPVPLSLQMFAHTEQNHTVSVLCEDKTMAYKVFDLYAEEKGMEATLFPFLEQGEEAELPAINLFMYRGDWHFAADRYGEWFRSFAAGKKTGSSLEDMPVLNELFIKGRPGEPETGCGTFDAAVQEIDGHICSECNALSLVGWQGEGHDNDYPGYTVGEKQGGVKKLKGVIRHLHALKMLSGLYTNGRLVDKASVFYNNNPDCLIHTCDEPLNIVTETWGGIVYGIVNPGNKAYIENYLKLTERLFGEYGIDYMQMDQVGAAPGFLLYNRDSGYSDPAKAWSEGIFRMLQAVNDAVIRFNKRGFTFIEGAWDGATQFCGLLQGGDFVGDKFGSEYFPEFFSYTMFDRWIRGDILTGTSPLWVGTLKDASVRLMRVCKEYIIGARFMDTVGLEYDRNDIKATWRDSENGILVAVRKKQWNVPCIAEFTLYDARFHEADDYFVHTAEDGVMLCAFRIAEGKIFVKIRMDCDTAAVIIRKKVRAEA